MQVSRRKFLAGLGAAPAILRAQGRPARPKLAAICTAYFKYSHSQHIVDRFLEGYGWNGTHHHPAMDLISIYIDQIRANDVSKSRLEKFPSMKLYPTIPEALTLGGSKLAVDGVILIGEHGQYPRNEKGQTQYPRYPFFQEIVKVFRSSGRSVPVFNDKHLSWNWDWAREMYDTSRSMGFPFMAGSSLPVTWRTPSVELPLGSRIREAMCVCYGGVDSYDFHGLETLQCMVERRSGEGIRLLGLSVDRRGLALREQQDRCGRRAVDRRAWELSAQRQGTSALSTSRVFQAVRGCLREGRSLGSGLQRQAPFLQLRESAVDGGCIRAPEVPDA